MSHHVEQPNATIVYEISHLFSEYVPVCTEEVDGYCYEKYNKGIVYYKT